MNPINAKALLDLAVTVIAAITSEVIEARKRRSANNEGIGPHDRPS